MTRASKGKNEQDGNHQKIQDVNHGTLIRGNNRQHEEQVEVTVFCGGKPLSIEMGFPRRSLTGSEALNTDGNLSGQRPGKILLFQIE